MHNDTLSELNRHIGAQPIDIFICCASFEERSKTIAMHLSVDSVRWAWICYNRDYQELSQDNLDELEALYGGKHTLVELDTTNPLLTADRISASLADFESSDTRMRIVIDVTAFTRESLLILVKYLFERRHHGYTVEFVYANAREYSVGDSSEEKWLSKGNREVRSVLGYPGVLVPSKQSHLIVMVGFEDERALSLIYECEPSRISLGIGNEVEWATRPHQDTNVARFRRLKNLVGAVDVFTFAGYDAVNTKRTIQEIVENTRDFNTVIAPMNTKISTLGAAMVALEDERVQICYAQANIYNTSHYSSPGRHFFHLSMTELLKGNH